MDELKRCHNTEENASCSANAMKLWRILQIVIYTEQQIRSLRECLDLYMKVIGPNYKIRDYFTGSIGDGFHFDWSDIDILHSLITDYVSMGIGSMHPNCKYIAIDKDCQPGYCKLLYKARSKQNNDKCRYLSRISFLKEKNRLSFNSNSDKHVHGPCLSTAYGNENGFDQCNALPIHTAFSNAFLENVLTNFWNNVKTKVINESITVMHCVPKRETKREFNG